MRSQIRREKDRRSRISILRPHFDRLEAKLVLSTATMPVIVPAFSLFSPILNLNGPPPASLSVVAVTSTEGTTGTGLVPSITATFNTPIDPTTLGFDFDVLAVGADGSTTPIEMTGNSLNESLSDDGLSIVITTAQPLAPGSYTLVLSGNANIVGLDGSSVMPEDQTVDSFTIRPPGIGLGDATVLGSPVGKTVAVSDSLDLSATPDEVKLYRVDLPATRSFWQLGVELDAGRIGSNLTAALTLFDANGRPIKTSQSGRPDYPGDPFLFAGLAPGTYYIGVSGAGNVPGAGGYDLATETVGVARQGATSGAFTLKIAADPANVPTQVRTFFLNYADPTDPTPTGLTLQFNTAIDESALKAEAGQAILVVDASGKAWTAHVIGYNEAQATVSFVFDCALPEGTYSVKLAGRGGLVNLAGQAPVSSIYPDGTLAMFLVGPPKAASSPTDLGPVFLNDVIAGISRNDQLAAGQSVTYRVVITVSGFYSFQTSYTGELHGLVATINGVPVADDFGAPGSVQRSIFYLTPGVVTLSMTAGPLGARVNLFAKLPGFAAHSLLDNGVGQSAALGLRLISPESVSAGAAPAIEGGYGPAPGVLGLITPTSDPASPSPSSGAGSSSGTGEAAAAAFLAPTANYLLTTTSTVGHPSFQNDAITVVGPVTPGGLSPLASIGMPVGLSVGYGETTRTPKTLTSGEIEGPIELTAGESVDPAVTLAAGEIETTPAPVADPISALTAPGQATTLIDRAVALLARLAPAATPAASAAESARLEAESLDQLGPESGRPDADGQTPVETANLSNSLGVGFLAVAAATMQHKFGRWIERRKSRLVASRRPASATGGNRRDRA